MTLGENWKMGGSWGWLRGTGGFWERETKRCTVVVLSLRYSIGDTKQVIFVGSYFVAVEVSLSDGTVSQK